MTAELIPVINAVLIHKQINNQIVVNLVFHFLREMGFENEYYADFTGKFLLS